MSVHLFNYRPLTLEELANTPGPHQYSVKGEAAEKQAQEEDRVYRDREQKVHNAAMRKRKHRAAAINQGSRKCKLCDRILAVNARNQKRAHVDAICHSCYKKFIVDIADR